jgi:CBS-domain-containing membrane protein
LLGAARSEETSILLREVLGDAKVRDVMSTELVMAPAWVTIDRFINDFAMLHLLPAYPVQNFDGSLFGIVTWTHLRRVTGDQRDLTRVQEVATSLADVVTARPEEPLTGLLERLDEGHDGYALVLERQSAVGLVGPDDITRAIRRAALLGVPAGEGSLAA